MGNACRKSAPPPPPPPLPPPLTETPAKPVHRPLTLPPSQGPPLYVPPTPAETASQRDVQRELAQSAAEVLQARRRGSPLHKYSSYRSSSGASASSVEQLREFRRSPTLQRFPVLTPPDNRSNIRHSLMALDTSQINDFSFAGFRKEVKVMQVDPASGVFKIAFFLRKRASATQLCGGFVMLRCRLYDASTFDVDTFLRLTTSCTAVDQVGRTNTRIIYAVLGAFDAEGNAVAILYNTLGMPEAYYDNWRNSVNAALRAKTEPVSPLAVHESHHPIHEPVHTAPDFHARHDVDPAPGQSGARALRPV